MLLSSELAIVREGFFVVRVATFQTPQLRPSDSAGTRAFQDGAHTSLAKPIHRTKTRLSDGRVGVDIPFKFSRDTHSKNIVTNRKKRTIGFFITNAGLLMIIIQRLSVQNIPICK